MLTEYSVTAVPHKELTEEIVQAKKEKPVYLEALFVNGDPFAPPHVEEVATNGKKKAKF